MLKFRHLTSQIPIAIAAASSLVLHTFTLNLLSSYAEKSANIAPSTVTVQVRTGTKQDLPNPRPKPIATPPEPPKKRIAGHRTKDPTRPVNPKAMPIAGLTANSVVRDDNSSGPAVAVGNTMMTEDKGIRKIPEEIEALPSDLSADAKLIRDTIQKPKYTDEALDAELQGKYVVEVFVNPAGIVEDAVLTTKVGFGMDTLLLNAARMARFEPRKDRLGGAISGWTQIVFQLSPRDGA